MKTEHEDERMVPELHKGKNIYGAHLARYAAAKELVKGKTVLDIACGSGYGAKTLAETATKVYGVDIDEGTVKYARTRYGARNIEYKAGSGTAIPMDNDAVDVVVSFETIEHIDEYEKFLSEVKRVLKKDGLLLLSTPNDEEYIEDNEFHLHQFSHDTLNTLLAKHFKHHLNYYQTIWLYNTILPENLQTQEWEAEIKTINTCALSPERAMYFFTLCSDKPLKNKLSPIGVTGENYRLRDVQASNKKMHAKHESLIEKKQEIKELSEKNKRLNEALREIYDSPTWKITSKMKSASKLIKRLKPGS